MQIGASFGITPDFEVGAIVLPIQFNNGAGYGGSFVGEESDLAQPTIYGTFRFFHGNAIELGARLAIQIVVPKQIVVPNASLSTAAGAVISPSMPLLVHIGKVARLDAAVGFKITVSSTGGPGGGTQVGLDIPVSVAFNIIEPLHVGASTGVHIDYFSIPGHSTLIPLGIFAGYAIGEKRPIVDIDPFFSFYEFVTPGGGLLGDTFNPGIFITGVSARGYIYL
jgi:hypothetical protein